METAEMRRSTLQRKDREELTEIASTLGKKPPTRARKGEIIDLILELVSGTDTNPAEPSATATDSTAQTDGTAAAVANPDGDDKTAETDGEEADQATKPEPEAANNGDPASQAAAQEAEPGNRRRRRRGRERENNKDTSDPWNGDVVPVAGYLELRPEGYGFLRVDGALPSKDDAYVPVKMVRQYNLDKGVHLSGTSRPAGRNEKNPAMVELLAVNGGPPEAATERVSFDEQVPVFPDERLVFAGSQEPEDPTARIVDMLTPLGRGQRALVASAPRAGKTTVLKHLVRSIEVNHTDVELLVLLVDERPEDITDMTRWVQRGEVIGSPFDQPTDEQITIAEMTIERAKRMVEDGKDVCLVVDGITRLARAYILESSHGGRSASGSIDRSVVHACKRFLGAARNIEGGGSLTVVATIVVDSDSSVDEAIYEELANTANLELRLSRALAVRRIFPAVDIGGSGTHNEEILLSPAELEQSRELRRRLMALASADDAAPGDDVLALLSDISGG
ncbi:MAG: transcription termination factor Rho [Acidimicrobiaceae bacterium]|nr:transcription termination factor Rho [Acidimicrobiaceae bacterium]